MLKMLQFIISLQTMQLEFIELQHRQKVLKLVEICGLSMQDAYQLFINSGYNFEVAVNRHFNPLDTLPNAFPQQAVQPDPAPFYQQQLPYEQYQADVDAKYEEYKAFKQLGLSFDKKYRIKKRESFLKSLIPRFLKGEEEDPFKRQLQKFIGKPVNLKNNIANLTEAFLWSYKQKFALAIIFLNFTPESQPLIKKVFSDQTFLKIINEQFQVYCYNVNQNEIEPDLRPFFNVATDSNSVIVCRVNHIDQVDVVERIKLSEDIESIKKRLKLAKSEGIQRDMDDANIRKQYNQQMILGDFNYQRPKTIKENLKMKEDRRIRMQQEQQFFKHCLPKQQQQQQLPSQLQKTQQIQKPQPKIEKLKQQIQQVKPKISLDEVKKRREQSRSNFKTYDSGIGFKVRLPSGKTILLYAAPQQHVQYLFDFIESHPDDLGFVNEEQREFDIFVGFGGTQTLKGKQSQKLCELFEDSQVLIVREVTVD